MDFLPVFLRIKQQRALVVGGGQVALRKVHMLLRAEARIRLVAPEIVPELQQLLKDRQHQIEQRDFFEQDLEGCKLVIAATADSAVNMAVFMAASKRHLPVNVVDQPELCSFIFPSIVDRSPLVIAVSSGGASPVHARLLRARLETFIPSA